ncbi:MAG: hypothetical protein JW844_03390 [Candidatus Omnitrophica bacterium]|nr:hypothetical protein [Candidatus Omnitrophota bacterium]
MTDPQNFESLPIIVPLLIMLLWLLYYAYFSFALQTIARKTNTPYAWLAWVPLVNFYLMCTIARQPGWYVVLFFVPVVNIVIPVYLWMKIAEEMGQPGWIGLLWLVPVVNLFLPGYLAFSGFTNFCIALFCFIIPGIAIIARSGLLNPEVLERLRASSGSRAPVQEAVMYAPAGTVEGISYSEDYPSVIINGEIYTEADMVGGGEIVEITRDHILVSYNGMERTFVVGDVVTPPGDN